MWCPECFREKGETAVCPFCGYNENTARDRENALPYWTRLFPDPDWPEGGPEPRYQLGRVLGKGGFGITYLAWDRKRREAVALKEFLPPRIAERGQSGRRVVCRDRADEEEFRLDLRKFLEEARTLNELNRLGHENLVRVRKYFQENGTGYLVMNYYRGMTLAEYLDRLPERRMSEAMALSVMQPVMDGLRAVHERDVLHRDVKPSNIYLVNLGRNRTRPVLLDFGAARRAKDGRYTEIATLGYAPPEQYSPGGQGPWTDVYACAATLYRMVGGRHPDPALARAQRDDLPPLSRLVPGVSAAFSEAVARGMAIRPEDRPQTVAAFQALLREAAPQGPPPGPPPERPRPPVGEGGPDDPLPPIGGGPVRPRPPDGGGQRRPVRPGPPRPPDLRPLLGVIILLMVAVVVTVFWLALMSALG